MTLDPGEQVLSEVYLTVSQAEPDRLPVGMSRVLFTNRRIAFLPIEFGPKSGGYAGGGTIGLLVSTAMNAASRRMAQKANASRVGVCHLRYEWVAHVEQRSIKTKAASSALLVFFATSRGPGLVVFSRDDWATPQMCQWVAQVAAADRLRLPTVLADDDRELLTQVVNAAGEPVGRSDGRTMWHLPGDLAELIEVAYSSRFTDENGTASSRETGVES